MYLPYNPFTPFLLPLITMSLKYKSKHDKQGRNRSGREMVFLRQPRGNTIFYEEMLGIYIVIMIGSRNISSKATPLDTQNEEGDIKDNTLEQFAHKGCRILFETNTVFPFVLFTDHIIVDESKVTVTIGNFFRTQRARSVLIRDIANIIVDTSYYFATVQIIDRHFLTQPITVKYIPRKKAILLRQFVTGLIIAENEKIDLSQYGEKEIREYVIQIGGAQGQEELN